MYLPLQSVIGVTLADIRVYKSSLTTCVEAHSKKSPIQSAVSLEIIQKQSIGGQVIATYSITDSNDWLATWEDRLDSEREGTLPGGLPTEPSESD